MTIQEKIRKYLKNLDALLVAHLYQKDEVIEIADIVGDSLELARKASVSPHTTIIFCGVAFMGQSVKILAPSKRVIMPKLACCSMAKMIDDEYYDKNLEILNMAGITKDDIFPITYINSSASIKAKVGEMGGVVCNAIKMNKKIFFLPDRCLGTNLANKKGLKSCVLGEATKAQIIESDVVCYNGYCSVHQVFTINDINLIANNTKVLLL